MKVKLIKTDADHKAALARIEQLWNASPGSPGAEELELLTHLVEQYESATCLIPMSDPISAIQFCMEQEGLKPSDLIPFIGGKSKVSEMLNGKRPLSLSMIRRLHFGLSIPAEVLLQNTPVRFMSADGLAGGTDGRAERRKGRATALSHAKQASSGHPLGGESFPEILKTTVGGPPRPGKRGRKKKETAKK